MDRNEDYEDEIREWLSDQDDDVLIDYWNHYQDQNCYEDKIYPMYDLEMHIEGMEPIEIVKEFSGADFDCVDDNWFYLTIYGWFSFSRCCEEKCPIEISDLAHWIDCNHDDYIFEEFMADKDFDEYCKEEEDEDL